MTLMKIPEKVKKFLTGKVGWVGTASRDGMPNIAIKGSLQLLDDEHLLFADLFSLKTRKNLEENPKIAVMVTDMDTHAGYIFKGSAELISEGPLFSLIAEELRKSPKKLPEPKYVVKIAVERIFDQSLGPNAGGELQ
jgi:predicted pyridoxine 5'-phosphate oxidase superfamily flavin-nucleotide-binding protein